MQHKSAIAAILALSVVLTGCGSAASSSVEPQTEETAQSAQENEESAKLSFETVEPQDTTPKTEDDDEGYFVAPVEYFEPYNLPDGYDTGWAKFDALETALKAYGYTERKNATGDGTIYEDRKKSLEANEEYHLTPKLDESGNLVFAFDGNCQVYTGTDENGDECQYIISGVDAVPYNGTTVLLNNQMILREEGTCKRIYLFKKEEQRDEFLAEREQGAEYLKHGSADGEWKVVLNGRYVSEAEPMIADDGYLYVPLKALAEAYNTPCSYDDGNELHIATDWGYISVPNSMSDDKTKEKYNLVEDWVYYQLQVSDEGVGGTSATYTSKVHAPLVEYYWVTPETLGDILGWEVYIRGNIIDIVSDSLDDSSLTAIIG